MKGAIIGAGFFAGIQAEAWNRIADANIIAVADTDTDRAQQFAERWSIPHVFNDIESLIQQTNPDFVDIATRPDSHRELVAAASRLGCHSICQKPMAPSITDCEAMVNACKIANVRLIIHENWRWQPWYRAARQAIADRDLGPVFHLQFQVRTGDGFGPGAYTIQPYFVEMERLLIYETLVHHLDTSRFLVGEVESVYCQTSRINPKIVGEDSANVSLRFKSGATGVIDANRINGPIPAPKVFGILNLECERGAVRVDGEGQVWTRIYESQDEEQVYEYDGAEQGYRGDSVLATQEHIIDSLRQNFRSESEGSEYLKSVRLVEACYQSAASNQVITIDRCPALNTNHSK